MVDIHHLEIKGALYDIEKQLKRIADQGEAKTEPSPADELAKAVERVVACDYSVSAGDNQNDQRIFIIENILRSALIAYREVQHGKA